MTDEKFLSLEEIKAIPIDKYPFMVFSDNVRGFFSWGVKVRTKGSYGHFMWLVGPDQLVSQSFSYKVHSLKDYSGSTMKLVYNPKWTAQEQFVLIKAIVEDALKPWYRTLYDYLGIVGQAIGVEAFNSPFNSFCSERGKYLKLVDPEYDLCSPSPVELNKWTKERPDRYKVYGRYAPD